MTWTFDETSFVSVTLTTYNLCLTILLLHFPSQYFVLWSGHPFRSWSFISHGGKSHRAGSLWCSTLCWFGGLFKTTKGRILRFIGGNRCSDVFVTWLKKVWECEHKISPLLVQDFVQRYLWYCNVCIFRCYVFFICYFHGVDSDTRYSSIDAGLKLRRNHTFTVQQWWCPKIPSVSSQIWQILWGVWGFTSRQTHPLRQSITSLSENLSPFMLSQWSYLNKFPWSQHRWIANLFWGKLIVGP